MRTNELTNGQTIITVPRIEAYLATRRAALPPECRITFVDVVSLTNVEEALTRLKISASFRSPMIESGIRINDGRLKTIVSAGELRFDYGGEPIRTVGMMTGHGMAIVVEHTRPIPDLLDLIWECMRFPPDQRIFHMDGDWKDPSEISRALEGYGWDSVYSPKEIGSKLAEDARTFFANAETYREMGLPYRRGILITGPPGNGKTSFARALVADNDVGFVLVSSLSDKKNPATQLRLSFERAAWIAPAILCLEDVDGLVQGIARNELLNQLDGLGRGGDGVLTVATTNYPEKLDAALTERPSRFDAKWIIKNPGRADRRGYLAWRLARSDRAALESTLDRLARETAGLTYAMLQDLALRAITRHRLSGEALDPALLVAAAEVKAQVAASKRLAGDSGVGFLQED